MSQLIKIAITPERIINEECEFISILAEEGWDMIHLRHPGATYREMRNIIEAVPQKLHRKLKLHGHFELTNHFNLGGVHLNRRCPLPPVNWNGGISCSMHSIDEIINHGERYDYVTLSPIYDSISKKGYGSRIDLDEFSKKRGRMNTKVIALGGVDAERIESIEEYGFDGYAVLGAIFEGVETKNMFVERIAKFK